MSFKEFNSNSKPLLIDCTLQINRISKLFFVDRLSDPDPLRHNSSAYETVEMANIRHESEIGPELIHIYQVENKGPSDIEEAQVFILWPSFRPNGDPLLYLTSQPIIEGMAKCEIVEDVNPFQVEVDRFRSSILTKPLNSRPDFFEDYVNDENRPKRDTYEVEYKVDSEIVLSPSRRDQELIDQLDCGPTKCTHMACKVGPLKKKESVVFRIYSRLWSNTIARLSHHQYEISSRLVSVVTKLPHNVDPTFLDIKTYTGKKDFDRFLSNSSSNISVQTSILIFTAS